MPLSSSSFSSHSLSSEGKLWNSQPSTVPSGVPQAAHSVLSMSVMRCGGGEGRAECAQQRCTMMLLLLLQRNENRHS